MSDCLFWCLDITLVVISVPRDGMLLLLNAEQQPGRHRHRTVRQEVWTPLEVL